MNFWQEPIKIGSLKVPRFIAGPLDGITDSPFRRLVREFSPEELQYTEMRHVGCVANDKGGKRSLRFDVHERPLNYQIAANSIDFIDVALERIIQKGIDALDLNVGCPAKNVIHTGSGSALMGDLPRLKMIVTKIREKTPNIPFTVKIRAGFKCVNAVEVAQMLQDCGVDALAIHPRLQKQKFEGQPDYALAAQVKKAISIPLIISGGVVNWKTAKMVHEMTGVDGFLIGRGIWGKPWKLKELKEHAAGNDYRIDTPMIIECALKHFDYMLEYYGPHGLYAFRKHLPFYVRGIPQAAELRVKLMVEESADVIREGLQYIAEYALRDGRTGTPQDERNEGKR